MNKEGLADAIKESLPDSKRLVAFILSKVSDQDRFAVAEAVKGISLNAIDFYLSTPDGTLSCFFKDTGLSQ